MTSRSATTGSPTRPAPVRVRFANFELDEANATLLRDGKSVAVQPTPFALLCALVRQPGALLTKQALLDQVWGHQFVSDSVLKTAISDLRKLLDDDPRQPRLIETVSRRGYRFVAATAALSAAPTLRSGVASMDSRQGALFIGRADALARLGAAWDAACGGRRAVVWVAGEPGIGKTMLIEHFVAGLGEIACARGQCVEHYGAGEPYLPVLEALAELCRRDAALPALLRAVAPTWLMQMPWLSTAEEREALRRELAGIGQDRMLREMAELLDRYTEHRPLLLVTEDLHWSDRATLELINYVARRRGGARLMWLASFRVAEVVALDHPLNPLRHELRLHGLCEEITLDPFSESEIAEYVAQRSASLAADEAFVHALQERTDGVPLFVSSIIDDVAAHATAQDGAAGAKARLADIAVPENLALTVDHYIARLTGEQRSLLSAAAVCGVEFRASLVAQVLEQDSLAVSRACEDLAREHLWLAAPRGDKATEPPYSFRHALFRQVLYERTAPAVRTQLHRRVGEELQRERAAGASVAAAELAMHFELGRVPLNALGWYAAAAEAALARFSPAECMTLVERAQELLDQAPGGSERNALELALGTLRGLAAFRVLGAGEETKAILARAYSLLDEVPQHPARGRLLHGFGFMLGLRAEYADALAVADRAQALGAAANDPLLLATACTVHGETDQLQGRWTAARSWLERGLSLVEGLEVGAGQFLVDPQVALLGQLTNPLLHLGQVDAARACVQRALARANERGWPMARLVAAWHAALFEVRLGDVERVAALAGEIDALVHEHALANGRTAAQCFRGWAQVHSGKPRDGYRLIREAYEENKRLGMRAGGSEVLGYAAEALVIAGDCNAAEAQLKEALAVAVRQAERVYLVQLHLTEAAIARARGDAGATRAALERALAEARAQESPWLEQLALKGLP